jgi:hypothetical protein
MPRTLLALAAAALLGGCTHDEASESGGGFAREGDTGAAAPATKIVPSPNTPPDSTTGVTDVGPSPAPRGGGRQSPSPALPGGKASSGAAGAQQQADRVRDSLRRKP